MISLNEHKVLLGRGVKRLGKGTNCPNFYAPDYFLGMEEPWFHFDAYEEVDRRDLPESAGQSLKWKEPNKDFFDWAFTSLRATDLQKGVPFAFAEAEGTPDVNALIGAGKDLKGYLYGVWDDDGGIFGVTPELLFSIEEGTLKTMALAGTLGHHANIQEFEQDPKETIEHQLVIDWMTEALEPFGEVTVHPREVMRLSHLSHLHTPITVALNGDATFETLIRALHPTPALGAFPRDAGWKWLRSLQAKVDRERYGAPFGVVHGKIARAYVCIRGVQWNRTHSRLGAGAGVVAASDQEREWQEVLRKMNATKKGLRL